MVFHKHNKFFLCFRLSDYCYWCSNTFSVYVQCFIILSPFWAHKISIFVLCCKLLQGTVYTYIYIFIFSKGIFIVFLGKTKEKNIKIVTFSHNFPFCWCEGCKIYTFILCKWIRNYKHRNFIIQYNMIHYNKY